MRKELTYELAHVGINLDETSALETAGRLAELFQLETRKGGKSYFAGDMFECIRIPFRGTHGHIGLRVSDMQAAMADLEEQGLPSIWMRPRSTTSRARSSMSTSTANLEDLQSTLCRNEANGRAASSDRVPRCSEIVAQE